jgi:L-galactose dehydrogenase
MRYRALGSTGPVVSEPGFVASPLGGIYGTFGEQDGIAGVRAALAAGISFLDVSP